MKGKFKKIISCLLVFALAFSVVQIGNTSTASAATQDDLDKTFVEEVLLQADGETLKVDKRNDDILIVESVPMGISDFTIEGKTGYAVTDVTTTGKMSKVVGGTSASPTYTFSGIKDYSDFNFTIKVKMPDGTEKTYTVKIKFDIESSLQFDNIRLTYTDDENDTSTAMIPFNSVDDDGYYRNNVEDSVKTVKIELISNSYVMTSGVKISGDNIKGNVLTLVGGDNVVDITVTNNSVSRKYSVIIYKKGQALLKSLVPSTGSLSPKFDSDTYDYEITVPTTQTSIAFTPTAMDNASTIKVDKNIVKSGKKSGEIKLSEGSNRINISVTTKEGKSATYVVKVIRTEKVRSAKLSALKLSSGTLNPKFDKDVFEYTATVENTVSSITVTPTVEDKEATVKVNGTKVTSGTPSKYINLDEGGNLISVVVTDDDGNSNTYTINITRKYPKENANLSTLSVTDGTMSPRFDPETYLYSVKVNRNIDKVRVKFTTQNEKCKVKIYKSGETTTKTYTNGQQSDSIPIELGANLIIVEVTAEDGKSITTYKLSVIRDKIEGTNQWVLVSGEWTFYNGAGVQIKNQWVKYDNDWYFLDINGHRKTGWILESGKYYYLNADGIMQTGWFYEKGYWYYLSGDGSMFSDRWEMLDGKWYFFNSFGEMQTGWTLYRGYWYFLDDHGVMQKGWITYDKNKYYINDDGTMKNGWLFNGKTWYYFDSTGRMMTGWQTIDGKNYYFDSKGAMKTGKMFLDGKWINLDNL